MPGNAGERPLAELLAAYGRTAPDRILIVGQDVGHGVTVDLRDQATRFIVVHGAVDIKRMEPEARELWGVEIRPSGAGILKLIQQLLQ